MALVLKDRVKETTTTTGTGSLSLLGAAVGYQAFSVIGNGNTCYYAISAPASNEWEVGIGTYTTSGAVLSRDTVLSSSNSGTLVSLSAGTKDVYVVYPAEKAIYEEAGGETLINGGPITIIGSGVTSIPSLPAELGKFIGDVNSFAQIYTLNQNDGTTASADFVAYNDLTTDGYTYFTDMGISSSNYTSLDYPIFTPNSGYVFHQGGDFFIGNQTTNKDIKFFSGGVENTDLVATFSGTDKSVSFEGDLSAVGDLDVTGAAAFGSTVLLNQDPTLALQAATKQYVDNLVTAGLHIHTPVLVETTGNLTATYAQGGTTFNITTITTGNTVTTSVNHGLSVGDQIWLYSTAGNGLSINTAYFVYSTPALNTLTLSLTFGGAQISGLTNAAGLTYATRANSGVGATLTNAGTQVALNVDNVALSIGNRVMVRLQTNGFENGVYTVTTVGSGSTNWVLTRATDANKVQPEDPDGLGTGDYFYTQDGDINAGDSHVLTTEPNTMIIGYTDLTYTQFSGAVTYTGGTNIDVTGQTISLTGTVAATNGGTGTNTVTTGDLLYGSASNTWSKLPIGAAYKSLLVNAGGTQVEWNAVALNQSAAVSGALGPINGGTGQAGYTTGDILYSSATDTLSKLSGNTATTKKYLSQTGTGSASAAPSWVTLSAADIGTGVLPAIYGGTGQSSYSVGDLVYADTTTTLAKLADVATGNVLLSGGTNTAPAYGKVGLGTHISGTLAVSNGGTGLSTLTANGVLYASTTSAFSQDSNFVYSSSTLSVPSLSLSSNLTFTGTGNRITGDFSNGTLTNRVTFQSSTTNGNTAIQAIPNGTATQVQYALYTDPSIANGNYADLTLNNSEFRFRTNLLGTGTAVPITMYTGGSERLRITTSGGVSIGTTTDAGAGNLLVNGTGTFGGTIYTTGSLIEAGRGSGSAAFTINDGYGNANVAFNHKSGTPDVNGSSGRITCNVDSTTSGMTFQLGDNTTAGIPVALTTILGMTGSLATFNVAISSTGAITGTSFSGAGTGLTGTATSLSIGGNAATATGLTSSNYIVSGGTSGNWDTDFQNTTANTKRYNGDIAGGTNNPGGTWWFQEDYRHSNSSNYWGTQVAWGWEDNANKLAQRNVSNGVYSAWVYYLNSGNVATYALPIGGGNLTGNLGIGVSPTVKLDVNGITGWGGNTTGIAASIVGPNAFTNGGGNLRVLSNSTAATNAGGSIAFGGYYSGQTNSIDWAEIAGRKHNSGTTAGYLVLSTRPDSGSITERIRIDPDGLVGIGTSTPSAYNSNANELVIANTASSSGMTIASGSASVGYIVFAGNTTFDGVISYQHSNNRMGFATNGSAKLNITALGGISFGSTGTNYGTSGQILQSAGDASPNWVDTSTITAGFSGTRTAVVATTSGTSINVSTTIPAGTKKIHIILNEVSSTSTGTISVQLGTGGTPTTTGYVSYGTRTGTSTLASGSLTTGLYLPVNTAVSTVSGIVTWANGGGNNWEGSGTTGGAVGLYIGAASINLAGVCNTVTIACSTGTFDSGSVSLIYE